MFDIHGVDATIPDVDAETATREIPVPDRWFLGQPCTLRPDKAAIDGYTKGLARDLGARRVTENVVHAGPMRTDLVADNHEKLGPLIERLCLPRWGTVNEVAAAVTFLAGPDTAYITGASLDVDGGYNA
ncbi:hypothetical protein GCM10009559_66810 [Pseudonocardia zijingensis]|uniref:Enoyl-ACP reductase-like protein n=1 Tax=Pseudonocardia zijingensis TaxID=153376 RepID=A0ABN1NB91_9PSEU